jgi:hypothetical protein
MRIAILDDRVVPTNPIGSCRRRLLAALSRKREFTVFAPQTDYTDPKRIARVRVSVPMRP